MEASLPGGGPPPTFPLLNARVCRSCSALGGLFDKPAWWTIFFFSKIDFFLVNFYLKNWSTSPKITILRKNQKTPMSKNTFFENRVFLSQLLLKKLINFAKNHDFQDFSKFWPSSLLIKQTANWLPRCFCICWPDYNLFFSQPTRNQLRASFKHVFFDKESFKNQ